LLVASNRTFICLIHYTKAIPVLAVIAPCNVCERRPTKPLDTLGILFEQAVCWERGGKKPVFPCCLARASKLFIGHRPAYFVLYLCITCFVALGFGSCSLFQQMMKTLCLCDFFDNYKKYANYHFSLSIDCENGYHFFVSGGFAA
jgi:hypothetical protein